MAKYCFVMITMNRYPKKNYICKTIRSLELTGFFNSKDVEFHIFDSGSKDLKFLDCVRSIKNIQIHTSPTRLSLNENRAKALLFGGESNAQFVVFMEDDLEFTNKFLQKMDSFISKYNRSKMWNFYAPFKDINEKIEEKKDYWNMPAKVFYGTQCLAMRKSDAHNLALYLYSIISIPNAPSKGGDLSVGKYLLSTYGDKAMFTCSAPCLVQHTGVESSINNSNRFHITTGFRK